MHITTEKHWTEVWDPNGRVSRRIEDPQGDNTTGIPTVSTNLYPWELPETEELVKEHSQTVGKAAFLQVNMRGAVGGTL